VSEKSQIGDEDVEVPFIVRKDRESDFAAEEQLIEARWRHSLISASGNPWFDPGYVFRLQEQEREILNLLRRHGLAGLDQRMVLDVGCGAAGWLQRFILWGASPENLSGIDLIADRIENARKLVPSTVTLRVGNAAELDYEDQRFDVVVMSLVLSLVFEGTMRRRIASEALRVLKPRGIIIWYDYRHAPPWLQVRAMRWREIQSLFGGCNIDLKSVTPVPPLRRIARHSLILALASGKLPFVRTHYLGAIQKPADARPE
jgi:SAM-dependent methyltransferase